MPGWCHLRVEKLSGRRAASLGIECTSSSLFSSLLAGITLSYVQSEVTAQMAPGAAPAITSLPDDLIVWILLCLPLLQR